MTEKQTGGLVPRKTLSRKVKGAAGIGAAVATLVVAALEIWRPELVVSDAVAAALATLLSAVVGGYLFTERGET